MDYIHPDLFPFQKEGAQWLATQPTAMLADEMGVGKTCQAIAGADLVKARSILVLCPGIARDNWEREFQKWQMVPRTTCLIKKAADRPNADVVITSYHAIMSRPVLKSLLERQWDLLICDEAHALKNGQALTTMIVYGAQMDRAKGLASKASRVWLLTGTPFPNGPHEMWTHTKALFPDAAVGVESYGRWLDRFTYWEYDERGDKRVKNIQNVPEFAQRLRSHIKRRMSKDVMPELPPLRFGHMVVAPDKLPPMDAEIRETEAVIRAAIAKVKGQPTSEDIAAIMAAEQMHLSSLLRWTGIAKAPAVAEAIKTDLDNGLDKLVVFAHHQEVFTILKKAIPEAAVITGRTPERDCQPAIDAFQGKNATWNPRVLLLELTKGSTAITLTAAADVAFVETGWVPKDIQQAVKRCHRIGQDRPVLAKIYSLKGSLDEIVNNTLVRKQRQITLLSSRIQG